jgi:hypothetical protein
VNCAFSRETLALHAEGDLSGAEAARTEGHLATCRDCRDFFASLRNRQALLKSLRRETVSPAECIDMRREVMSIVTDQRQRLGWLWRVERSLAFGLQRRPVAVAGLVLLGVLSVTVIGQVRSQRPEAVHAVAEFDGRDALRRPEGYRDWILLQRPAERIYITPSAHRARTRTGQFPEGTVMVWEPAAGPGTAERHHQGSALLVSVKNSARFDGGWGFFDFTGADGRTAVTAQPLPESSG